MTRKIIHYVDSSTFGGNEQALLYLIVHMDRERWQLILFHHDEPGILPFLEQLRQLGVKTKVLPRMRGRSTISGLPRFIFELRREKPDVFHAHLNWLLSCKYGLLAAALAHVPLVVATLQQYLLPPWGKSIHFQQRIVAACVDQYIAVSQAVARQLSEDFGVPGEKIKTIHNSIPFRQYDRPVSQNLRDEFANGAGYPIALTIARLDDQKGHRFLLEAAAQLPEVKFVLAGDGPIKSSLIAQARSLGIDRQVLFLGHRTDIPDLLANSDLLVLPSIYEGLPLSILEAMAAGRAVVATAAGGTPEVVVDGETGFLVRPGDPTALAGAIRRLIQDPEKMGEMGAAGKERVKKHFDTEKMAEHINRVYKERLANKQILKEPKTWN
jgi:glycosyltransferase involved in cell wall biosynthesis